MKTPLLALMLSLVAGSLSAAPTLALSLQPNLTGLTRPLIAGDPQDNLIVAGMVTDCSHPVLHPISTCGAYWIAKFDPTGSTMLFGTYLGTPSPAGQVPSATLQQILVDAAGNLVILSSASQTTLPAVSAIQSAVNGSASVHLMKLSADGSTILYATYLGGSRSDYPAAFALDDFGAPYIYIYNTSPDFPLPPAYAANFAAGQFFIVKLSADGKSLVYLAPFFPSEEGGTLSVDAGGSAVLDTIGGVIKVLPDGSMVQTISFPQWSPFAPAWLPTPDGGYWLAGTVTDAEVPVTANAAEPSNILTPYLRIEAGIVSPPKQPLTGFGVNAFGVDPFERFRIYAATATGLFKSEDNGWIWTQIYPSGVSSVLVDPFDQNTLYIVALQTYSSNGLLYCSTDRGQTWSALAPTMSEGFGGRSIMLAADPNIQGVLYLVDGQALYVSQDRGHSWKQDNNGWAPPLGTPYPGGSPSAVLSDKAVGVFVDGSTPGRVYVLAETSCTGFCPVTYTLSRSNNGGATFDFLNDSFFDVGTVPPAVYVDPSTGDVFTPSIPAGKITVFRGGNFSAPQVLNSPGNILAMAFDPEKPGSLYVSIDNGALLQSTDGGNSFQSLVTLPSAAAKLAVGDGKVIHVSQVADSTDGVAFKIDSLGNISYGTYFGSGSTTVKAAALAPNGHLFIAGSTGPGIPLANAIQPTFGGGGADAFLAEFDASGTLVSSTYLGGPLNEEINSLTVLADGSILAIGATLNPGQAPLLVAPNTVWRVIPSFRFFPSPPRGPISPPRRPIRP
jgi:photosystem II stability/assembly factor-like uncharacterized protein